MLRNLTVGKKIAIGFGVVIVILVIVVAVSFHTFSSISSVVWGNTIKGIIVQREVDHLNWVNKVNAFLTDESVETLDVETDDHKCGLGKWLYGDMRKEAEERIPGLAAILKEMEEPHRHLHESAVKLKEVFVRADPRLPSILVERQVDHLKWAQRIRDTFLTNGEAIDVQTDPTKCALGKWLNSPEAQEAYRKGSDRFRQLWDELVKVHKALHESAEKIKGMYAPRHEDLEVLLKNILIAHKDWVEKVSVALIEGNPDIGVETDPTKCMLGKFLHSDQLERYSKNFPILKESVNACIEPHRDLHNSAI